MPEAVVVVGREDPGERGDIGRGREVEPAEAAPAAQLLKVDRALAGVQAARSIQRSACSVHSFRCMRRKAFCAPGRAIAFSALRARSSCLTESPKLGLALRHTFGSV